MFNWIGRWIDRLFAVVGAIVFSQAPLFIQQYTQQLSGHLEELKWQVEAMTLAAEQSGRSLSAFLQKFTASTDVDIARQGAIMESVVNRYQEFQLGFQALLSAAPWSKPFVFLSHFNLSIGKSTLHMYQPGFPFTAEGLIYALIGLVIGWGLFSGLVKLVTGITSLFIRKS